MKLGSSMTDIAHSVVLTLQQRRWRPNNVVSTSKRCRVLTGRRDSIEAVWNTPSIASHDNLTWTLRRVLRSAVTRPPLSEALSPPFPAFINKNKSKTVNSLALRSLKVLKKTTFKNLYASKESSSSLSNY